MDPSDTSRRLQRCSCLPCPCGRLSNPNLQRRPHWRKGHHSINIPTGPLHGGGSLDLLGVFAELETNLRRKRQMEAIRRIKEMDRAKPLSERTYRGRPATIDVEEVHRLKSEGLGATAIAAALGIGRASVYRLLNESAST